VFFIAKNTPTVVNDGESINYRRLLLAKCKREFENKQQIPEPNDSMSLGDKLAIEEARNKLVERNVGVPTFIGSLYLCGLLNELIVHQCIITLLSTVDESDLNNFALLITTVGKSIDHPKAKELMDKYFIKIEALSASKAISPRIRFKLKDVIDLRKNEWIPKRPTAVPKTIEKVHRDAELEKLDKERKMNLLGRESRDRKLLLRTEDDDEEDEDEFLPPAISLLKKPTPSQTPQQTQPHPPLPTLTHISTDLQQTPQQTQPPSPLPTLPHISTLQLQTPQQTQRSPTLQRSQTFSQSYPQLPTQELLPLESPRNLTTSNSKNKQPQVRHSGRRKPQYQSPPSSPKYQYVVSSRDIPKTHQNSSPVYIKKSERQSPSTQYKEVR